MSWLQALFLAVLQGLTEFLPVSSSGHLAIAQTLWPGMHQPNIAYGVVLHVGTLAAVVVYFRREIKALFGLSEDGKVFFSGHETHMLLAVVVASVPTGLIGLAVEPFAKGAFKNLAVVGGGLLLTGLVLLGASITAPKGSEKAKANKQAKKSEGPSYLAALCIGVAQGLAVVPGISRSGSTVAAGLFAKLDREQAFAFSFLISIPAILGATALEARDIASAMRLGPREAALYVVGGAVAGVVGYFALGLFARAVRTLRFSGFAYYCFCIGIIALVFGLFA